MPHTAAPTTAPASTTAHRVRRVLIALGIAGLLLSIMLTRGGSGRANAAYARFFTSPSSSITRIVLSPSDPPYTSPISAPIVISNPTAINSVLMALRPAAEVQLNHPGSLWRYEIEIADAAGSSHGTIEGTSNQGVLLYTDSGFYTNDQLNNLLQNATGGSGK